MSRVQVQTLGKTERSASKTVTLNNPKSGNVLRAHYTSVAGMSSTCNHIVAALFHVKAAMRLKLIIPACTKRNID